MAVAKERVWTHYKETYAGHAVINTQYRMLLYKMYSWLASVPGVTVVSSCNGAGDFGNNDGVDRWAGSEANIVGNWPGGAHSWIVFKFLERYFMIDCQSADLSYVNFAASDSLFGDEVGTAGTATTAPTSTSSSSRSVWLNSNGAGSSPWACGRIDANRQFQLHGMSCAEGLRLFISSSGLTGTALIWDTLGDARGVPYPVFTMFKGDGSTISAVQKDTVYDVNISSAYSSAVTEKALVPAGGWSDVQLKLAARDVQANGYYIGWNVEIISGTRDGDQRVVSAYNGATNEITVSVAFGAVLDATSQYMLHRRTLSTATGRMYLECQGCVLGTEMNVVLSGDDWDDTWPFSAVRCFTNSIGHRWCRGRMVDAYWGAVANANGQLYDTDLTRDWVQYGHLIVPNDGDPAPVT